MESTPEQILQVAKKHKNSYNVMTDPATIQKRDFQIYNITMKNAESPQDHLNFRRGLAYIDEIIDHKHKNLTIAKKGLRKFHDLMPQFLDMKNSHFTNNKHQLNLKSQFINSILGSKSSQIKIYQTQKLNGQNFQISHVYNSYWVIGTKNKTLLLKGSQSISQIKYKHQHRITIMIAKQFFKLLQKLSQNQVEQIKQLLQENTLIGQFINPYTSQHVVEYKVMEIIFFAMVNKNDRRNSCTQVNHFIQVCTKYGLKHANYKQIKLRNQEQLIVQTLVTLVTQIQEKPISQKGEGSVLYIQQYDQQTNKSRNLNVSKVKTLQYRILRKLRQKLKMYIQKAKKGYQKTLKKYIQEVNQLVRQFKTPQPLQYYFEIAERAFQLCEDQTKLIARFVSIQYVNFLNIVKNKNISKEKFMQIISKKKNQSIQQEDQNQDNQNNQKDQQTSNSQIKGETKVKYQKPVQKKQLKNKRVLVFVPITIPATGKTTLFKTIKQKHSAYPVHIISSDSVRLQVMQQKMKKNKSMSKSQAYEKSRKQANQKFYEEISNIYAKISKSQEDQFVFLIDKNHPQSALKAGISQYRTRAKKFLNLQIKIVCLLPQCEQSRYLCQKSKYFYPFSCQYILTCLKRVSKRPQHETLQGSLQQRLNIVIGFTNMFRNFHLTPYNLSKHFDHCCKMRFYQQEEQVREVTEAIEQLLVKILMGSKVGTFDQHSELPKLVQFIQNQWDQTQSDIQLSAQHAFMQISTIFKNFDNQDIEQAIQTRE